MDVFMGDFQLLLNRIIEIWSYKQDCKLKSFYKKVSVYNKDLLLKQSIIYSFFKMTNGS